MRPVARTSEVCQHVDEVATQQRQNLESDDRPHDPTRLRGERAEDCAELGLLHLQPERGPTHVALHARSRCRCRLAPARDFAHKLSGFLCASSGGSAARRGFLTTAPSMKGGPISSCPGIHTVRKAAPPPRPRCSGRCGTPTPPPRLPPWRRLGWAVPPCCAALLFASPLARACGPASTVWATSGRIPLTNQWNTPHCVRQLLSTPTTMQGRGPHRNVFAFSRPLASVGVDRQDRGGHDLAWSR